MLLLRNNIIFACNSHNNIFRRQLCLPRLMHILPIWRNFLQNEQEQCLQEVPPEQTVLQSFPLSLIPSPPYFLVEYLQYINLSMPSHQFHYQFFHSFFQLLFWYWMFSLVKSCITAGFKAYSVFFQQSVEGFGRVMRVVIYF